MSLEQHNKVRKLDKKKNRRNKTPNETLRKSHALGTPDDKQLESGSSDMRLTSSGKNGEVVYNDVDRADAMKKDVHSMVHVKKEKRRKRERGDLEGSHGHDRSNDVALDNGTIKGFEKMVEEATLEKVKKKKRKVEKDAASSSSVELVSDVVGFNMASKGKNAKMRRNDIKVDEDILALNASGQALDKASCGKKKRKNKVLDSGNNLASDINVETEGGKIKRKKEPKDIESRKQNLTPEETTGEAHGSHSIGKNVGTTSKSKRSKEKDSLEKDGTENSNKSKSKKKSRRVSFSGEVQVFPVLNEGCQVEEDKDYVVRGKRFTQEEDEIIKKAVYNYIEVNQLGDQGLDMVLHCSSYPEIKGCWKDIGACIPYRPYVAIYYRAHCIFERSEKRGWTPDEYELLLKHYELHGSNWKQIAELLGKHRVHVKDAWRRIRLPNVKKGQWSQEEYQGLFDLVNLDLRLKAFEEKKTKHGMLRDNIAWEAISQKLGTRRFADCCTKWYNQLTSSLVGEGLWVDTDDYRLIEALLDTDACCIEDVDWDNLLEHRPGDVCQKRWNQMVRYIGGHRERPFIEQVEVLAKRFCPEMLEYRQ